MPHRIRSTGPAGRRGLLGALAGLALISGCAEPIEQVRGGCPTRLSAELPAQIDGTGVRVPVLVDGTELTLQLDTGATGLGLLSAAGARQARVQVTPGSARAHWALSGRTQTEIAPGVRVEIPGLPPVTGPVAVAPEAGAAGLGDGLVGAALLAGHDLEIDPWTRHVRFHEVAPGCERLVPFTTPYVAIPLRPGPAGLLFVPVRLDGRDILALLDTGASGTLLLDPGIDRLGLRGRVNAGAHGQIARDWSGNVVPGVMLSFGEVMIGPARARNRQIPYVAAPIRIADAILGRDYLVARRIWISYATMTLFIAR